MDQRRVAVTGLGAVTPLGDNVRDFWQRLIAAERGIKRITKFDPTGLRNEKAGEVSPWMFSSIGFQPGAENRGGEPPDEATQFLLTAARQAIADAELSVERLADAGVILGTNFGGAMSWERFTDSIVEEAAQSAHFAAFRFDTAAAHLRHCWPLHGPSCLLSSACASGTAALGYAFDLIRCGQADIMLAGGHDALAPSHLAGLSVLRTITPDDIRPFSRNRSGTLFGEGAGVLVLEEYESARARGVQVYCEVLGWAQNNNAYHLTAPDEGGAGMRRVLQTALDDARVEGTAIDYINAHGTGTEYHDPAETQAIKAVLGDRASEIGISSIKGAIGHLMGAAGVVEAIATVKTLQEQVLPPTVNYDEPDPECDLDYVPNEARSASVSCAATISAGIGGSNACVILTTGSGTGFQPVAENNRAESGRAAHLPDRGLSGTGFQPPTSQVRKTRRNLPHWEQAGATYFITFRLKIGQLSTEERQMVLQACLFWHQKKWIVQAVVVMPDHVHILAQPLPVRGTGFKSVHRDSEQAGGTGFQPVNTQYYPLSEILHSIKSYTANQINNLRGTAGSLWVDEHFDRIVRKRAEFDEKFTYMASNPVKSGLAPTEREYPYFWQRTQHGHGLEARATDVPIESYLMSNESAEKIVITGIGPLCAVGTGREQFWAALAQTEAAECPAGDAAWLRCEDFQVDDYLESQKTYLDRCSQFTLAACYLAVRDADLAWRQLEHPRLGLALGTAFGCLDSMLNNAARVRTKGARLASPVVFMHSFANTPASLAAIEYNIQGPTPTFCDGDISAGTALHYAWHALRWGQTDVMLAGGVDVMSNALIAGLGAPPGLGGRTWAEGACLLVMERATHAQRRGARVLAEEVSCAVAGADDDAAARQRAITQAGQNADLDEIPAVFEPPTAYGHTFGASLALDVAAAIGAGQRGQAAADALTITQATADGRAAAIILRNVS